MALLLDTQMLIWLEDEPEKIKFGVKEKIFAEPVVFFSLVSVWEMAIKIKTRKLALSQPLEILVANFIKDYDFEIMPVNLAHIYYTQQLQMHHKDPFDRLLIAQSLVENTDVVSSDEIFDVYGVNRIW
jgi:PIN domain nuclease of toxin-antitoxin system